MNFDMLEEDDKETNEIEQLQRLIDPESYPSNATPDEELDEDYIQDSMIYNNAEVGKEVDALRAQFPEFQREPESDLPEQAPPMEMPEIEAGQPSTSVSALLGKYKDAQQSRRDSLQNINMIEAASGLGTAIGTRGKKTFDQLNPNMYKAERDMANLGVNEIEEELKARPAISKVYTEEEMSSPDSEISKFAREFVKSKFPDLNVGNLSAKQLDELGFKVGSMVSGNKGMEWQMGPAMEVGGVPMMTRFNKSTGDTQYLDPRTGQWQGAAGTRFYKSDVRSNKLTGGLVQVSPVGGVKELALPGKMSLPKTDQPGQPAPEPSPTELFNTLNGAQREYLTNKVEPEAKKELTEYQEQLNAAGRIKAGLKLGAIDGDMIRAIQNAFARLNGEKGMMSEADVAGYKGRSSILAQLQSYASMKAGSKISAGDRKFLMKFADLFEKESQKFMATAANKYVENTAMHTSLTKKDAASLLNLNGYFPGLKEMTLNAGLVQIKDKKTGKVKGFKPDVAEKLLQDKNYEKVQ